MDHVRDSRRSFAYVGTYTPNGLGIHRFKVDQNTGWLDALETSGSGWLAKSASADAWRDAGLTNLQIRRQRMVRSYELVEFQTVLYGAA